MYIFRIILMGLGTLPILAMLIIGIFIFEDSMVKPRKHASVERSVAAWNAENWKNGDALKVTAQLSAGDDSITVLCVNKQFRSGRRSYTRHLNWPTKSSQHSITMSAPFGDSAKLEFMLGDLCNHVSKNHDDWILPHAIRPKAIWAETVAHGHTFRGTLKSAEMNRMLQEIRPEIVMVEAKPLNTVMLKERYLALSRY